jgi:glycogen debranching enzyme
MALQVVAKIEARLWTPLGLRSLASDEPAYTPHYIGGVHERDSVYHQGNRVAVAHRRFRRSLGPRPR